MHHYHGHHTPIWFALFSLAFLAGIAIIVSMVCSPSRTHYCPEGFPPGTPVRVTEAAGATAYVQACWGPDITVAWHNGSYRQIASVDARALARAGEK